MFEPPGLSKQTDHVQNHLFSDDPKQHEEYTPSIKAEKQRRHILEANTMTPSSYNGLRYEDDFTSVMMSQAVNHELAQRFADIQIETTTSPQKLFRAGTSHNIENLTSDKLAQRQKREKTKTIQPHSLANITEDPTDNRYHYLSQGSSPMFPSLEESQKLKMNVYDEIKNVWNRKDGIHSQDQSPTFHYDHNQLNVQHISQQNSYKNVFFQDDLQKNSTIEQNQNYIPLLFQQQSQIDYPYWNQQQFGYYQEQNQSEQQEINEDMQLKNQIDKLWANQLVSRQLQKLLEFGREDQKEMIVSNLERMCPQIAKDIFGNYVVQKVFEKCNDTIRARLFAKLTPHFYDLSKNTFGCRVMQKIINFVNQQEALQDVMIRAISDNYKTLIYDDFGNYVLHKMLETFPANKLTPLIQVSTSSFAYMIQQPYGCKIIVKLLEIYPKANLYTIYEQAFINMKNLISSEGGNYVVQQLLKTCPEYQQPIKQYMMPYFCHHSKNKYTSNTMEKLLDLMDQDELGALMIYLIKNQTALDSTQSVSMLTDLATNASANYVIKKLVIQCESKAQKPLLNFLRLQTSEFRLIKASQYGQKIAILLEQILKQN